MATLRISHVVIQPVLVWDDGVELSPGPQLAPASLPLSKLAEAAAGLPAEIAAMQKKLESEMAD